MKADAESFTFLGNTGEVVIPFFQRGYVWEKDNWEELLTDLCEFDKPHFLGSLILKNERVTVGKTQKASVIDGQQRLTTLSLLLKALYDSFSDDSKKDCAGVLSHYLFYKEQALAHDYEIKIRHSRVDSRTFYKVIGTYKDGVISQMSENEILTIGKKSSKILQCYRYFLDELKKKTETERKSLFETILHSETKLFVLISLGDNDNEQAIFDTINNAGIRLTSVDTVKNALFKRIEELSDCGTAESLYDEYWGKRFEPDDETIEFWKTKKQTGRLTRDNGEILLHCIAVIKGFYNPDRNTLNELANLYKNEFSRFSTLEMVKDFLKDIDDYAKKYYENFPEFDKSVYFSYNDDPLKRLLHILKTLEISTLHPFVLHIIQEYKNEELFKRLAAIERFVIMNMICGHSSMGYNKDCSAFIKDEGDLFKRIGSFNDKKIREGLEDIDNKKAALLLFWIELFRRKGNPQCSITGLPYNFSLEHIMPQKWQNYWGDVPCFDESGNSIDNRHQIQSCRDKKIRALGNMTLLNNRLNSAISNSPFKSKIRGDGKKKGMKDSDGLLMTNEVVWKDSAIRESWDERDITQRTKELYEDIALMWGQQVNIDLFTQKAAAPNAQKELW